MWWDPAGTAGIRLMAILQFVLWTAPERPSMKWKRDTCSHRPEGCSHISTTCVCLPDYDLPFQTQETNSFVAGVLVHKRGSHYHQMTSYSSKSCQSDCEQLQPQPKNQPYCHRLQLWCSCYIKSVLHILNIAKKKRKTFQVQEMLCLFFFFVCVSLPLRWRGPTAANHQNCTNGARKTRIYARGCRERSKRGKPGHGRRQTSSFGWRNVPM